MKPVNHKALKRKIKIFFKGLILSMSIGILFSAEPVGGGNSLTDSASIITGLFKSIDNIKTLTYTMAYKERLDEDNMQAYRSQVKYKKAPRQVYVKMTSGVEIIWLAGVNDGDAWVHKGSFPDITLRLDPNGSLMRKGQHHSVESSGYDYFEGILKQAYNKAGKGIDSHITYMGAVLFDGTPCYKIVIIDPDFTYVPYVVLTGETVISIAKKLCLSEYMIMQHNDLSSYTSISPGQKIMVPNYYGKKMILYIDETTMLPLFLEVDDEKGLFEQYIYSDVKLNANLPANAFSINNKDYHF